MKQRTAFILIAVVLVSVLGIFFLFTNSKNAQPTVGSEQNMADDLPLWGSTFCCQGITLEKAKNWSRLSGFKLAIPKLLPQGYFVDGVYVDHFIPRTPDQPGKVYAHMFQIVFAKRHSGGLVLTAQKAPINFEEKVRTELSERGQNVNITVSLIKINGRFGIHSLFLPEGTQDYDRTIVWVDGETLFHLYANSGYFSFEDLLKIAESIRVEER